MKKLIQRIANLLGYKITHNKDNEIDGDKKFLKIYNDCKDYTMTSRERMFALYKSVQYIIKSKIPGDFVECGVWKGGSAMLIALTLKDLNTQNRRIYLYDTFKGMVKPTEKDHSYRKKKSLIMIWKKKQKKGHNTWSFVPLTEAKKNMASTGYPEDRITFVKGKVEETIPKNNPKKISLLRLDTDWYESTKHELIHLFPLLSKKGVLIIDDYGHYIGSKKAVDEYFLNRDILLNRIDYTGRIGIKV